MSLQVFVNGLELVNGPIHRLNIRETTGLWDPAALVEPGTVETFEGPFRVRQTTVDFGVREITIVGSLYIASVSYADKLRALEWLQSVYAPRPSRVVVGSLELLVDFGRVQIQADELKRLTGTIRYQITGTAIPATLSSSVSAGTGYVQGLAVDTARVNEAATLATMSSGVGTITVLGDAPTPAVITIQNNPSTARTYYLATSATGRRVPITTDANGVGRIDERSGFYLSPGLNRITAYQAATGTATFTDITVMSLFGTTWRFTGNAPAGNVTRYDLGPALTTNRTGSARYFLGNTNPSAGGTNGIVTAGDDEPRIGWSWLNRRNIIVNSVDLRANWVDGGLSVRQSGLPDAFGYEGGGRAGLTAADATTVNIANNEYSLGGLGAVSYVASVYILKDGVTSRRAGFQLNTTGGTGYAILDTSNGTALLATNSSGTLASAVVGVSNEGLWWRLYMTWTGEAANNWRLTPALTTSGGTGATSTAIGSAVFACPQVELGTTPSPYQATDANGIAIDHPANDAGLVLEGLATNLCLYSEDQSNAAWVKGAGGVTSNAAVAPDGTTTADRLLFSSPFDASTYQIITGLSASANNYTWSVWVKATTGTVAITMQVQTVSAGVPTNTDIFTDVVTTVGTNWTRISITGSNANTSIALLLSAGASFDVWGSQLELGTAATSYIPTTTAAVRREADICGVLNPHNLLTYSEDFSNAAWVKGSRITVTANNEAGPDGIQNADRVVLAAGTAPTGAEDNIRQPNPLGLFEIGKTYTLSCWVKVISGSPTMRMFITNAGPSATTFIPTTSWQRWTATYTVTALTSDGWTIDFNNSTSGFTVAIYGAQVTEGYLPGRYVRTTDTAVLPTTAIDPSWSQNGYIEADIAWPAPSTTAANIYIFGDGQATSAGTIIATINSSGSTIRFGRYDSSATLQNAQYSSASDIALPGARMRFEWTNYTLAGSRYMFLRIYLNGVLKNEVNYAGRSLTAWPAIDVSRLWRSRGSAGDVGTISSLTLGVPTLPQGVVPAGI